MSAFVQGRHRPAGPMRVHFVVKCRNRSFMSEATCPEPRVGNRRQADAAAGT